jgi:hypothetical protein
MLVLKWNAAEINGLLELGLAAVLTEIAPGGFVLREIGLDGAGSVVYRAPDDESGHDRALFSGQTVDAENLDECDTMRPDEFERLWDGN